MCVCVCVSVCVGVHVHFSLIYKLYLYRPIFGEVHNYFVPKS